jgi:hypothetical protein
MRRTDDVPCEHGRPAGGVGEFVLHLAGSLAGYHGNAVPLRAACPGDVVSAVQGHAGFD